MKRGLTRSLVLAAAMLVVWVAQALAATAPAPPPNDNRDSAQSVGALPAAVNGTTVGSTVEANEPPSGCARTAGSVWYSVTFTGNPPGEVGVKVQANGDLDAAVDVFQRERSQNIPVSCARTDDSGLAGTTFQPSANSTYLIRVAQRSDSSAAGFSLHVFVVPPPPSTPGPPLPQRGGHGVVDSIFNTQDAYSMTLRAGTTYKFNLVNPQGGCMSLGMFAPGTTAFSNSPTAELSCAGYRLFTPQVSGHWSFLVTAAPDIDGAQPYALHVAPATTLEMAPGIPLPNLTHYTGALRGNVDTDVRLFSFDVTSLSELTLKLRTSSNASFNLKLLSDRGRFLDCGCGSGGGESIQREVRPGRYFAVVQSVDFSSGSFTLSRESRAITHARVSFGGYGDAQISPGASTQLTASISGAIGGSVTFELEYFDPVAGWQFRGYRRAVVVNGVATLPFTAPTVGRWRVSAVYNGTRSAAPATSGWANLLVAGPLVQ